MEKAVIELGALVRSAIICWAGYVIGAHDFHPWVTPWIAIFSLSVAVIFHVDSRY